MSLHPGETLSSEHLWDGQCEVSPGRGLGHPRVSPGEPERSVEEQGGFHSVCELTSDTPH